MDGNTAMVLFWLIVFTFCGWLAYLDTRRK